MEREAIFLRDTAGNPKHATIQDSAICFCSGSQSQCRVCFILPARGASHIIRGLSYSVKTEILLAWRQK